MNQICTLLRRNLRVFFRHRAALVFTLLAPLVIVALYAACFHGQLINMVSGLLPGSTPSTTGAITAAWIVATTTVLTAFTSGVGFVAIVGEDRAAGRHEVYQLAHVSRFQAAIATLLAIFIVTFVMSTLVVVLGQGWLALLGQPLLTSAQLFQAAIGVLLTCLFFTGMSGFAAGAVTGRMGLGIYLVLGTLAVGFLSYAWALPQIYGLPSLLGILPFALATALIREPMLTRLLNDYAAEFSGSQQYTADLAYSLGARIQIADGTVWPVGPTVAIMLVWVTVILIFATLRLRNRS